MRGFFVSSIFGIIDLDMKKQLLQTVFAFAILSALMFQSCGNIDIVKRRYRPGFHVDVSKKKPKNQPEKATVAMTIVEKNESVTLEQTKPIKPKDLQPEASESHLEASTEIKPVAKSKGLRKVNDFIISPIREVKRQKLGGELRRAVFNNPEDENYGWSTVGIVSTGLGVLGFGLFLTGAITFFTLIIGGSFAFWWLFLLLGVLFGIAAMVTGIIGLRQTRRGGKRGRGFALGGMISGIISLAGGLIVLLWGFIYTLINGTNEDF